MLNNGIPPTATRRDRRRAWLHAALTAAILVPFAGCASKLGSSQTTFKQASQLSHPDNEFTTYGQTSSMQKYFTQKAKKNDLPVRYLSEARIGITKVDTDLAEAFATELERDATVRKGHAQISNKRVNAAAFEETQLAELSELKKTQDAEQARLIAELIARERQTKAIIQKNARMAEALAKERRTIQKDLISRAETEFDQARAHIEELRAVRIATEKESVSAINQARVNAQSTRDRASATVVALRQEAQSATDKTTARVGELTTRIATLPKQFQAKASHLRTKAASLEGQANAKASALEGHAAAMETQDAEHKYNMQLSFAKTQRQLAQTDAERKTTEAKTAYERGGIEVDRMRADAHMTMEGAQSESARQMGELDAWFKRSKADIDRIRSSANRLEKFARADFVQALTTHAADAIRETNEHQQVLSEAQMKATIAEAEADAAMVHEHLMKELARQTRAGNVDIAGKTAATNEAMDLDVDTPPKVAAVANHVAPETIATFRSSMAKVLHDRMSADAQFSSLEASYTEQKSNTESVREQKMAVASEQLAWADAVRLQAVASLAEENANITAELAKARSTHDRAMVQAETFRRNAIAEVTEMRAMAKSILDSSSARAMGFRKEAQMIMDNGHEQVAATRTELRAAEEQGEAETSRLLAEASSVEKSESALAEQIDAQIASAQQELAAELANLDRQNQSSVAIAQTNYNESLAEAEDVGMQAEMEIKRLAARNELEKAVAQSEIERLHDLHFVNSVKGEAEIERLFARAVAQRANFDAAIDAEQVAISVYHDITTAAVEAQRRIAAARANTIKSLFNTRLVEVDADRVQKKAEALLASSHQRANAETILAKARAARAQTRERMSLLIDHQKSVQRAALKDWDSRLGKNPIGGFQP